MRLDLWLWAVRAFKTRSMAVAAIRAGRVTVQDLPAKPARFLQPGESVVIRADFLHRVLRVLGFPKSRVGAPRVPLYAEDLTPPEAIEAARQRARDQAALRPPSGGRPTKRNRRRMDAFMGGTSRQEPPV